MPSPNHVHRFAAAILDDEGLEFAGQLLDNKINKAIANAAKGDASAKDSLAELYALRALHQKAQGGGASE